MADIKVTHETTASITFGYGAQAGTIKEFIDQVPPRARIIIKHWKGDQREPEQTTITAKWDPSVTSDG